jgi:hypothetical protein
MGTARLSNLIGNQFNFLLVTSIQSLMPNQEGELGVSPAVHH